MARQEKRAPRGSNSVNGHGGITKVKRGGRFTGWRVKIPDPNRPGKVITKSFKPGQKGQAQAWLKREVALMDEAANSGSAYVPPGERERREQAETISFRAYAEQYLAEYRDTKTGQRLREASLRNKRVNIGHLIEFFGDRPLKGITQSDVRECGDAVGSYGATPRKRALQELRAMMRVAARPTDEHPAMIDHNPCEGVPLPPLPESRQAQIPPATPDEIQALADNMPEYTRIAIHLGVAFGLRISEVCALQVHDLDFTHGLLHVRHALARGEGDKGVYRLAPTKTTASDATVPIPDALVPILRAHIEAYCADADDAMLIPARHGQIITPNTIRKQFADARVQAGRPDLHFHTLRATFDDRMSRDAGNTKDYMTATRRRDVNTGVRHYQRTNADRQRALANKAFSQLVKPPRTVEVVAAELEALAKERAALDAKCEQLEAELNALKAGEAV